jgi:hypothetical protein
MMVYDYLPLIIIPIGVAAIVNFTKFREESLISYLIKRIRGQSINTLTNIRTPFELELGGYANISVTYEGSLKDGFLSCKILDYSGDYNWCEDRTTVKNLGQGRQIGKLNFSNEKHKYKWVIQPKTSLKKGRGKLIIGAFETKDYPEKGIMVEDRIALVLETREVLLV